MKERDGITWESSQFENGELIEVNFQYDSLLKENVISYNKKGSNVSYGMRINEAKAIANAMVYFKNKGLL